MEFYADASFGAHENKSISGMAVYYSGCPIFWATMRQACIALSTAESELAALIEAWTALKGCWWPGGGARGKPGGAAALQ